MIENDPQKRKKEKKIGLKSWTFFWRAGCFSWSLEEICIYIAFSKK
jgi:hypothetical protein